MGEKKESSGWLLPIVIGIIVAILLIVVMYPNFVGKKNQKSEESILAINIEEKDIHFSYPH